MLRNKRLLAATSAAVVVLMAVETVVAVYFMRGGGFRWWLLGVLQTTFVAVALNLVLTAFLTYEGSAIHQLRGAWGEEATRDELARAKRKRIIWGWVDSIDLQIGDIDHIVVSRAGGLIAIDSKWRSDVGDVDGIVRTAVRLRTRAEGVIRTQFTYERGGHRARVNPLPVKVVVVIWGAARTQMPASANGVEFVDGAKLGTWLGSLRGDVVDQAYAGDVLSKFEEFRTRSRTASEQQANRSIHRA
ncbi:hypothetical protein Back2_16620 [Nocardioides baekrokdamisoli]|uniref:NERD domain-containing protein n=1 Tax=Nocardioides baekrokdamisoli TaxID=1804624 RepID=A0A3G9IMX0_9ACTN|nr:nuclease-related domain-containing protein [Nocardioides baekrokdamisoli]BBH17375.1 hypothetical protein Back2_16620 [Nocardioides baekrokdamisoli]